MHKCWVLVVWQLETFHFLQYSEIITSFLKFRWELYWQRHRLNVMLVQIPSSTGTPRTRRWWGSPTSPRSPRRPCRRPPAPRPSCTPRCPSDATPTPTPPTRPSSPPGPPSPPRCPVRTPPGSSREYLNMPSDASQSLANISTWATFSLYLHFLPVQFTIVLFQLNIFLPFSCSNAKFNR